MAWSTLPTYTSGSVLTAAQMNAIAANINETSAATVTTAGDIAYADGANSMGNRLAIGAAGTLLASTGSAPVWRTPTATQTNGSAFTFTNTSYADLDAVSGGSAGVATAITVTTGTKAMVFFRARLENNTGGERTFLSYRVSGATTLASDDGRAIFFESSAANDRANFGTMDASFSLTAGSNTFELQAKVSGGTGTVNDTEITVVPL